jgi:phosphoglycolate phosphatase-like HAD superfamily hydrolase
VFTEYAPDALEPVLNMAKAAIAGGKGDRKDIIRQILTYFGWPEAGIPDEVARRSEEFNAVVQKNIKRIGVSPQVREALTEVSGRLPLYLNTATPREAIIETLEAFGIAPLFKGVYGRPGTKAGNLRSIIAAEAVKPDEVLFVDDQPAAYEVAKEVSCQFVGIRTKRVRLWRENPQPFPLISSLAELPQHC